MRALRQEQFEGATIDQVKPATIGLVGLGLALAAVTAPLIAGRGIATLVLLLGAGLIAVGVGAAAVIRGPEATFGLLLAAAGCLWFLTQWDTPDIGSAVLFTVAIVGWGAFPAVVAHAALAYPSGQMNRPARIGVGAGYVVLVGLFGVVPALTFDPVAGNCRSCPDNLLLLGSEPGLVETLRRGGAICASVVTMALVVLCLRRVLRSSQAARRATVLVMAPTMVLLLSATLMFLRSLATATVPFDDLTRQLVALQAISLWLLSGGVVVEWVRLRRSRSRIARYALDIGRTAGVGNLRDILAAELRDPTLQLAYPLHDGRLVDAAGASTTKGGGTSATTALVHEHSTIAVLTHSPNLDHGLVEGVVSAAGLALDNERLSAQVRAQVAELAASQLRIIEAGDIERRRLERDLHDGAQQRLVALMLTLRLNLATATTHEDDEQIDAAIATLREVIAAVRRLAAGIYPAVLADAGLRGGLAALAEESSFPLRVRAVPVRRLPADVETAAYHLIATLVRCGPVTVSVTEDQQILTVEVQTTVLPESLMDVVDRIGAVNGTLTVDDASVPPTVRAVLPCG